MLSSDTSIPATRYQFLASIFRARYRLRIIKSTTYIFSVNHGDMKCVRNTLHYSGFFTGCTESVLFPRRGAEFFTNVVPTGRSGFSREYIRDSAEPIRG